jgi:hypothetical protein
VGVRWVRVSRDEGEETGGGAEVGEKVEGQGRDAAGMYAWHLPAQVLKGRKGGHCLHLFQRGSLTDHGVHM